MGRIGGRFSGGGGLGAVTGGLLGASSTAFPPLGALIAVVGVEQSVETISNEFSKAVWFGVL